MRKPAPDTYSTLRRHIILGKFAPGAQLKEQALASELGVSRSPIRLAFRRLEADGLIESIPNRGVFVTHWADTDNDEVFDLRALVEPHAAGLAAQRRLPEHLEQLTALHTQMCTLVAQRPENFREDLQLANRQFHHVILQAAQSPRLLAFVQSLLAVHRVAGAFFYYTDQQLQDSMRDHENILAAIGRGNARLARALVDAHIRDSWDRLRQQRQDVDDR